MRPFGALILISVMYVAAASLAATPQRDNPFDAAAFAPPDVTLYLHIDEAAEIHRELADRPIARWLLSTFENGKAHFAWARLAKATNMDSSDLFDLLLGRRLTLLMRGSEQWALVTSIDAERSTVLLEQLRAAIRQPLHGMAIAELPEQEIIIAVHRQALIIGPTRHKQLFLDVLPRLDAERKADAGELINHPAIATAGELGPARVGLFMRHDPPMGGWSLAVADVTGDDITLRHRAQFDNPPFNHGITRLTTDGSPVTAFEDDALLAFIQPMDIGDGPVESFVAATLNEGLISREMRSNLGDRRLVIVGEQEGRQFKEPVDALTTTFVVCMELKDREQAIRHLDRQMIRIARRLNDLANGAFLIEMPRLHCMEKSQAREIDLSPAAQWFTGGFPIMKTVSLNWAVAESQESAWYVVGSNPRTLHDVVQTLEQGTPPDRCMIGRFDSCGAANGIRIGRHLESWSEQADEMAEPGRAEELRTTLRMMSELASGMHRCRWQLARPSANEMQLDVQIKLTPPDSTGKP